MKKYALVGIFLAAGIVTFFYLSAGIVSAEWPETKDDKAMAQVGRLYQEHCMLCHGFFGKGDGPMAEGLNPKPRDFTSYEDMRHLPYTSDVERVIKNGSPGTSMPGFTKPEDMNKFGWGTLSDEKINVLALYARSFGSKSQYILEMCANEHFTFDTEEESFAIETSGEWLQVKQDTENPSLLHISARNPLALSLYMTLEHKLAVRTHFTIFGKFSEQHNGPEPLIRMTVRFNFPCNGALSLDDERPKRLF